MIASRNITKIVGLLMAGAVLLCILSVIFSQNVVETFGGNVVAMQYESELFDTDEIMQIDIRMADGEWEDMLENAMAEEYYSCDVVINGQEIYNVGIRPKGNTSLSSIAMDPDTDRFSLKLEFDHYVDGQTCLGLDKLILNNNYADSTNMKEALIYDMYQYLGADASLYNYAKISVNGEYWGVYLALEAVEDSFLLRNYGTEDGRLYKPENMDMGGSVREGQPDRKNGEGMEDFVPPEMGNGGEGGDFASSDIENGESTMPPERGKEGSALPDMENKESFVPPDMGNGEGMENGAERGDFASSDVENAESTVSPEMGKERQAPFNMQERDNRQRPDGGDMPEGGPDMGGGGSDLNYTDDNLDSYSAIWESEVVSSSQSDHKKVVTALKNISEGKELEQYLDIDNILKYMAVHTFSVNMDSLSGNMAHNYYLYEYGGKLNILPWDYNLAFGGMNVGMDGGAGASGVINDAIDTPFHGTEFFDALLENEEYLSRYHEYLRKLTEEYVFGGKLEETYQRIRGQIDTLVETDPTAFYSYEEYEAGAEMLYQTVMLRAESIKGQLNGTIPSTEEGQREDAANLVDASEIDIDVMGTFERGGR